MKAAIYLRTSTLDQHPEKQKKDCLEFAKNRGYEVYEQDIFYEHLSGYKQIDRPKYDEIKSKAFKGEIKAVIVWALDRWVRNRDTLLDDVTLLRSYGCKLHSVKEEWLEVINIEGSLGRTIQDFLLGLIGSLAEMESKRKSDRIKMAFTNHKGKKWGRPELQKKVDQEIIELYKQGKTLRQIKEEVYYWDKSNNKKQVSIGYVHKTIKDFKVQNLSIS